MNEKYILELSLIKLSEAFNDFIKECKDENNQPKKPSYKALMRASGFLPPYCSESLTKKRRNKK